MTKGIMKTKIWHLKVIFMSSQQPFYLILEVKVSLKFMEGWQLFEVNPTPRLYSGWKCA